MVSLSEIKENADKLSMEDKVSLADYLWSTIPHAPLPPEEQELNQRDHDMDIGKVETITFEQLAQEVGRE